MGTTMSTFQIAGNQLHTYENPKANRNYWSYDLERVSPTQVKLSVQGNVPVTGTLDPLGLSMTWSDGDVWARGFDKGGDVQLEPGWKKALVTGPTPVLTQEQMQERKDKREAG